jgi:hypothetical protein
VHQFVSFESIIATNGLTRRGENSKAQKYITHDGGKIANKVVTVIIYDLNSSIS